MAEYIERGALISIFNAKAEMATGTPKQVFFSAVKMIEMLPTADVVEVVHGEWVEERWCDNFQHICSLCHKTVRVHPQSVAYAYCPYCGTKMDGKDGEG